MTYIKTMISAAFLLLGLGNLHAQDVVVPTGGESSGTGGTISYTIGQVVYTTNTGTTGIVMQGVQLPYEISSTLGVNETSFNIELSVYPNPTTDYLTLKTDGNAGLSYQLYDLQGKVIENKKVNSNSMKISLEKYSMSTYFLNVQKDNQKLKTFKIIKN